MVWRKAYWISNTAIRWPPEASFWRGVRAHSRWISNTAIRSPTLDSVLSWRAVLACSISISGVCCKISLERVQAIRKSKGFEIYYRLGGVTMGTHVYILIWISVVLYMKSLTPDSVASRRGVFELLVSEFRGLLWDNFRKSSSDWKEQRICNRLEV